MKQDDVLIARKSIRLFLALAIVFWAFGAILIFSDFFIVDQTKLPRFMQDMLNNPGYCRLVITCCALFGIAGFGHVLDRSPLLVIEPQGIQINRWADGIIPWSAVRRIVIKRNQNIAVLTIELENPEQFSEAKGFLAPILRSSNPQIWPYVLDQKEEDILECFRRFADVRTEV